MALTILKLVIGKDGAIIIPQNIWQCMFPFRCSTSCLSERRLGRRNIFSPCAKIALMVLKAYTGFSDRQLVEHLNGNIHYQMFCEIMIDPSFPITNYKIVRGAVP